MVVEKFYFGKQTYQHFRTDSNLTVDIIESTSKERKIGVIV